MVNDLPSMSLPLKPIPLILLLACVPSLSRAAVINLMSGANNVAIQQLTLLVGGSTVVQTTEATGVNHTGDNEVLVKSVRITDGAPVELTFFNTEAAAAVNVNPELSGIAGVGMFNNGVVTTSLADGHQAYADAFAAASLDTDLRNFGYHDYLSPGPTTPGTPDLDLLFYRALNLDDYILVSERWGNSSFTVTALMADGNPYPDASILRLGGSGGNPGVGYEVHDWNTGYAAATNIPSQAQALTLFSVAKFFEAQGSNGGPVYGLRIENAGEADVKIMGISDNTFLDNPVNPKVVPEPSGMLLALTSCMVLLGLRRRKLS
jgi:hypothetical protein